MKWRAVLQLPKRRPALVWRSERGNFCNDAMDKGPRSLTAEGSINRVPRSWSLGATSPLNRFGAFKPLEVFKRHWFQHEMFAALCSAGMKRRGGKVASFLHSESRDQMNGWILLQLIAFVVSEKKRREKKAKKFKSYSLSSQKTKPSHRRTLRSAHILTRDGQFKTSFIK